MPQSGDWCPSALKSSSHSEQNEEKSDKAGNISLQQMAWKAKEKLEKIKVRNRTEWKTHTETWSIKTKGQNTNQYEVSCTCQTKNIQEVIVLLWSVEPKHAVEAAELFKMKNLTPSKQEGKNSKAVITLPGHKGAETPTTLQNRTRLVLTRRSCF